MADRIVVMNGGHVQQVGARSIRQPGQTCSSPDLSVRRRTCCRPAPTVKYCWENSYPLPPRHRSDLVWLGVRPEHITDRVEEGHCACRPPFCNEN